MWNSISKGFIIFIYGLYQIRIVYAITNCSSVNEQTDTCFINSITKFPSTNYNITCNPIYSNCNITCSGEHGSCRHSTIICPVDGQTCIINCESTNSCQQSTIISQNCKNVELNIAGSLSAGVDMNIYAPSDDGSLSINTLNTDVKFKQNNIYSTSTTQNIHINCNKSAECKQNYIFANSLRGDFEFICGSDSACNDNAFYLNSIDGDININCNDGTCDSMIINSSHTIDTVLNLQCNGSNAQCNGMQIYCGSNECNLWCSRCQNVDLYSYDGVLDVNWFCNSEISSSCTSSKLFCGVNQIEYESELIYDSTNSVWYYDYASICGHITMHPTNEPTVQPTNEPTTMKPTNQPITKLTTTEQPITTVMTTNVVDSTWSWSQTQYHEFSNSDIDDHDVSEGSDDDTTMIILVCTALSIIIVCCLPLLCCIVIKLYKDHKKTDNVANILQLKMDKTNDDRLAEWLKYKVKLPQYLTLFISNGYNSLEIVQEIHDREGLNEIGITLIGHQKKILTEIKKLNAPRARESVQSMSRSSKSKSNMSGIRKTTITSFDDGGIDIRFDDDVDNINSVNSPISCTITSGAEDQEFSVIEDEEEEEEDIKVHFETPNGLKFGINSRQNTNLAAEGANIQFKD